MADRQAIAKLRLTMPPDSQIRHVRDIQMNRRRFLGGAAGVAAFTIIPRHVLGGVIFVGDKGKLVCGSYGSSPRLIPESRMKEYKRPAPSIPRSVGHHKEWVEACKGGKPAGSNFDYAGPMTEVILLGNVAVRMSLKTLEKGLHLEYDGPNMKITNLPEANEFMHRRYREGWSL